MDVRITKCGELIVCHDDDLLRLCGDPRKVKDVYYEHLPKFLKKMPMHFSKFSKKDGDDVRFDTTFQTYDRKPNDADSFSLLEDVFKSIPRIVPMSIEVKDADSIEACMKIIELIKKYDRFRTTIIGGQYDRTTEKLLEINPKVCTFFSESDGIKFLLFYFIGLLPYLKINREMAALPYMTRDFIKMKYEERKLTTTTFAYVFLTFYIYAAQLFNMIANPALMHLQRRGICTAYWVINDESEAIHVLKTSKVQAIMTDNPKKLRHHFIKQFIDDNPNAAGVQKFRE